MSKHIIDQDCDNIYGEELPNDDELKKAAILKLKNIIAKEKEKPESQQNINLIDDCIKNIAELKGIRAEHTPEELRQKSQELLERAKSNPTATAVPKQARRKMRMAALVAAALILVCSISVCAFNPDVQEWLFKVIKMPVGTRIESNGVTYVYCGKPIYYSSIIELVEKEGLDILYPSKLPDGATIKEISSSTVDSNTIDVVFNSIDYGYVIHVGEQMNFADWEFYDEYHHDNISFYIRHDNIIGYSAHFNDDLNYYSVVAPDYDSLLLILNNLKGASK